MVSWRTTGNHREGQLFSRCTAVDLIPGGNGLADFTTGEDFFEHLYTFEQAPRKGLGPAWLRNSCIACHPSYGHGKRQTDYRTNTIGNGYLLVIYHPTSGTELNVKGETVNYGANSYISHVTGMPQTAAMSPFKAPIDENQIKIDWKTVTEMETDEIASAGNGKWKFADGETFELIYPEVTIPQAAFNTSPRPDNYEVRLEGTIGIYGTGLLDAITDEDMEAQWRSEAKAGVDLNPAMWDAASNTFAPSAYYSAGYNDTGKHRGSHGPVKRFTYAMTRGTLQDGAGQCYLEHHQRDPFRPPLVLHHTSLGKGHERRQRGHRLYLKARCRREQSAPSLLCQHEGGHCRKGERPAEHFVNSWKGQV